MSKLKELWNKLNKELFVNMSLKDAQDYFFAVFDEVDKIILDNTVLESKLEQKEEERSKLRQQLFSAFVVRKTLEESEYKYKKWCKELIKHVKELRIGALQDYNEIKGLEEKIRKMRNCSNCIHQMGYDSCKLLISTDECDGITNFKEWRFNG